MGGVVVVRKRPHGAIKMLNLSTTHSIPFPSPQSTNPTILSDPFAKGFDLWTTESPKTVDSTMMVMIQLAGWRR